MQQNPRYLRCASILAVLGLSVCVTGTARAGTNPPVYVKWDAPGANNGTSWFNAYRNLRTALQNTQSNDEVWVARGTYVPTTVADPLARHRSFTVPSGARVYGGFAGNELTRSQRSPLLNRTVLSGDIMGNDTPGGGNRADNSFVILWLASPDLPTIVDGFTIRGANLAENGVVFEAGGAVKISDGTNARLSNCIITDNDGEEGVAIGINLCLGATAITFTNCLVTGNRSVGACILSDNTPNVRFNSCTIASNTATSTQEPAAIRLYSTEARLINTIVWNNSNGNGAGQDAALKLSSGATASVEFCNYQGGTSGLGAGCISVEPCFVNPVGPDGFVGTSDDDFSVYPGSRMIDAGNGSLLPFDFTDVDNDYLIAELLPRDLIGNVRSFNDPGVGNTGVDPATDIGAYEFIGFSCPGDYTGDGLVNTTDLTRLLANFGGTSSPCGSIDLNGDGVINTADLVILLSKFGNNCNI